MELNVLMSNHSCKGVYCSTSNKLIVKQGSIINEKIKEHFVNTNGHLLREKLIHDGIIKNNEFVEDYEFSSPSQAASVIDGSSKNGRISWISGEGLDLNNLGKEGTNKEGSKETDLAVLVKNLTELFETYKQKKLDETCKKLLFGINNSEDPSKNDYVLALLKEKNKLDGLKMTLENLLEMLVELWQEYKKTI